MQYWVLNPRPFNLVSNALSDWSHSPIFNFQTESSLYCNVLGENNIGTVTYLHSYRVTVFSECNNCVAVLVHICTCSLAADLELPSVCLQHRMM